MTLDSFKKSLTPGLFKTLKEGVVSELQSDTLSLDELNHLGKQKILQEQKIQQKKIKPLVDNRIPKRFSLASIQELHIHDDLVINKVKQFVNAFDSKKCQTGNNMVLLGDVGTGKTQLACSIANVLKDKGFFVGYVTATELFAQIASAKHFTSKETEASLYGFYEKYDLLIIDEIGQKTPSASELNSLQTIIDIRSRNMRSMIAISNLSKDLLPLAIGDKAWSRLVGFDAILIAFQGPDLRQSSGELQFISSCKI